MREVKILLLLLLPLVLFLAGCEKENDLEGDVSEFSWNDKSFPIKYVTGTDHSAEGGDVRFRVVSSDSPDIQISIPHPGKSAAGEYTLGEENTDGIFQAFAYKPGIDGVSYEFSSGNLLVKNKGERYEIKFTLTTDGNEVITGHFRGELTFLLNSPPLHLGYEDFSAFYWNEVKQELQYISTDDNEAGKHFLIDFMTDTVNVVKRFQLNLPYIHAESPGTYVLEEMAPDPDFIHFITINEEWFELVSGTVEIKKKYDTYEIRLKDITAENGDVIEGLYRGKLEAITIK